MGMQNIVLKNRTLTNAVMSRIPSGSHAKRGEKYALGVVEAALRRTRAYPDYIKCEGLSVDAVSDMSAFRRLPVIDKRLYVDRYPLSDLALDGSPSSAYTIEKSSGHSGGSYYWLRLAEEDAIFPQYLEHAFVQFYKIDTMPTLVLITLALGTWTSGEKMAQALRQVAASGKYPLTVMAPGTNVEEILEIVADIGALYAQTIIVGYPPFVKTVIDEGTRRGLDWPSLHVKIGLGGEGYSEPWREHMASVIGVDPDADLLAVSGGYGAADVGMSIGREYAATVMIRKLCVAKPDLARDLFSVRNGQSGMLPNLLQYNPASCYIEEVGDELVFTALSGIPLVRYNIHDNGGVITFDRAMEILGDHGCDLYGELARRGYGPEQVWKLPFFYVYGRTDGTVSIVGANVFPQNIQAVLSESRDQDIVTFKLAVETTPSFSQRLVISLEHNAHELSEEQETALSADYYKKLVDGLRCTNADFRDAHDDNPEAADPIVRVHARGTGPFAEHRGIKYRYTV